MKIETHASAEADEKHTRRKIIKNYENPQYVSIKE